MARIDQSFEANLFVQKNKDAVEKTAQELKSCAMSYLKSVDHSLVPKNVFDHLVSLLEADDLSRFYSLFRGYPCEFIRNKCSTVYWLLVDGISSFLDAIEATWPYMTQDSRKNRLSHADEYVAELSAQSLVAA